MRVTRHVVEARRAKVGGRGGGPAVEEPQVGDIGHSARVAPRRASGEHRPGEQAAGSPQGARASSRWRSSGPRRTVKTALSPQDPRSLRRGLGRGGRRYSGPSRPHARPQRWHSHREARARPGTAGGPPAPTRCRADVGADVVEARGAGIRPPSPGNPIAFIGVASARRIVVALPSSCFTGRWRQGARPPGGGFWRCREVEPTIYRHDLDDGVA